MSKHYPCVRTLILLALLLSSIPWAGTAPAAAMPAPEPVTLALPPELVPPAGDPVAADDAVGDPVTVEATAHSEAVKEAMLPPAGAVLAQEEGDSLYRRVLDLGGGKRRAMVSTSPLNYRAADGSWQPIDPRFESVDGGFANLTNALQIVVAARFAALHLRNGNDALNWEPRGLWLIAPQAGGDEVQLARVLGDDGAPAIMEEGGTALHYAHSWSLPGLADRVVASPGGVEQSLVFDERPRAAPVLDGAYLSLRAHLDLGPGEGLYLDGVRQDTAFTAKGEIKVRNAAGNVVLVLAPVTAYEMGDRAEAVAGRYRFAPDGDHGWLVDVQTPWNWWQAPDRAYPALLDPYMTLHDGSTALWSYSEPDNLCYPDSNPHDFAAIGRHPDCPGIFRSLVRFHPADFPTLPTGAVVSSLGLLAVPTRGYHRVLTSPGYNPVTAAAFAQVVVSKVLSDWSWSPAGVEWGSYQTSSPLGPAELLMVDEHEDGSGALFSLPADLYTQWQNPDTNFGLELRLEDETRDPSSPNWPFVEVPDPATWTPEDRNLPVQDVMSWLTQGGGFMLVINYDAPKLQAGHTYRDNPLPTDERDVSAFTGHWWDMPSIGSAWSVVAVKGLRGDAAAGHASLKIKTTAPNIQEGGITSLASPDTSNYIVINDDPDLQNVEVHAFDSVQPGADPPTAYDIETRASIPLNGGNPIQPGQTATYTSEIPSTEIVRMLDLNLVAGTRVLVRVEAAMPTVQGKLFPPAGAGEDRFVKDAKSARKPGLPIMSVETGGSWGLVIEHTGSREYSEHVGPMNIPYNVTVSACTTDQVFTDQGCAEVTTDLASMYCDTVGPYWIRSKDPFVWNGTHYYNTSPYVYIGSGACALPTPDRWVLATNEVYFSDTTPSLDGSDNMIYLLHALGGEQEPVMHYFWTGGFFGNAAGGADGGYLTPGFDVYPEDMALPLSMEDDGNPTLKIDVAAQQAVGSTNIERQVETSPGALESFTFLLKWAVPAEGMHDAYSEPVELLSGPGLASVGPMTLRLDEDEWKMDFEPTDAEGLFTRLRTSALIEHSPGMGSGWQPVQALILPFGSIIPAVGMGSQTYGCTGNCLDIRHPTLDTVTAERRNWKVPDIEIDGKANTVALSKPGSLDIFSSDHPNEVDDVTLPFSFKTYGGTVQVYRDKCPGDPSGDTVQVVAGKTQMSLPLLGANPGESSGIQADFTLCDDVLRNVKLSYSGTPIPVGTTGLFIDAVTGGVTLTPASTRIDIDVHYRSGASGALTSGNAKVTIDTAGLLHAGVEDGKLVGFLSYDGSCDVTWSPLSFNAALHAGADLWIFEGKVDASVAIWQGQGWQNQYWWLPDDGATHFVGAFNVELRIPKGRIVDEWWLPKIPPKDLSLGQIALQVGEFFCGSCGDGFEYGIQGTVSYWWTLGYDVGIFYGFESGFGFILGGGQHRLVNQYPGMMRTSGGSTEMLLVGGKPLEMEAEVALDPLAPEVTYVLSVTAETTSFLVGVGWENLAANPQVRLLRPDDTIITPENAASYGVKVLIEEYGVVFGVEDPMGEDWIAEISNVTPDTDWHLLYFASNQVPSFKLLSPATVGQPWTAGTGYEVTWQVPASYQTDTSLAVSLYYSLTIPGVLTPTTGVIVDKHPFADGSFTWNTGYGAAGTYRVWGVLHNGGTGTYLQRPESNTEDQWIGVSRSLAPGTIVLNDTVPPPAPTGLTVTPLDEAVLACWNANGATDLAGYELAYKWTNVLGQQSVRYMRVPATTVGTATRGGSARQCARINNLNSGAGTEVAVVAYDATGNVSAASSPVAAATGHYHDQGPVVSKVTGVVQADHSVALDWFARVLGTWHYVYYAVDEPANPYVRASGATEGPSPILLGAVDHVTVHGLPPGRRVHFAVQAIDADGRYGSLSRDLALWLTNGVDIDGDGMPDDVEEAYGLGDPDDDPDRDCLVNAVVDGTGALVGGELFYGTNPTAHDTDGDAYTDGEEVIAGSDPLDPTSLPEDTTPLPRLLLDPEALVFRASTRGAAPLAQYVDVTNGGGGTLDLVVSTNRPWLDARLAGDRLEVTVDAEGRAHGEYIGKITVAGASGTCTGNAPQTITVVLGVFEGMLYSIPVYLPIVINQH